jgi:hypothetical protein
MDDNIVMIRPRFLLGKITNKYLIIEILAYSFEDFKQVFTYLHSSSRSMRQLLIENYIAIKKIIQESHLDMTIALTFSNKTSKAAHLLLEQIILRKIERIKNPDYGLTLLPGTVLKVANSPDTKFLLQPELLAIMKEL